MVYLALFVFFLVLIVAMVVSLKNIFAGVASCGGDSKRFAARHAAAVGDRFASRKAKLTIITLVICLSYYVMQVNAYAGVLIFAAGCLYLVPAFSDCVMDSYAQKELSGEFEREQAARRYSYA
jgi:hypothetical protein